MPLRFHTRADKCLFAGVMLLAVLTVPQMLCLPLTADTQHYDVQADCALDGGLLYRDVLEPNLPGVVWVHMLVRSIAGWSSEVLRAFDLVVLLGICVLMAHCMRGAAADDGPASLNSLHAGCIMLFVWWCYVSLPEWCHCQRDIWMLLPALGALALRLRNTSDTRSPRLRFGLPVLEGLLWGIAFWLKPFVAIPATCVWTCWAWAIWMRSNSSPSPPLKSSHSEQRPNVGERARVRGQSDAELVPISIAKDAGGLLLGGLIAGASGMAWLWFTGAWTPFWDVALNWNPEYFASRQNRWTPHRIVTLYQWLYPWWWAHLIALPVCITHIARSLRSRSHDGKERAIMSAFYLGWMIQVMCLQHPLLYIHASGVLLAIAIVADAAVRGLAQRVEGRVALGVALLMLGITSPALQPSRLGWWWSCLTHGPTNAAQNALQQSPIVDRTQLEPVIRFLNTQSLKDGELTVYSGYLVGLYRELNLTPSTRFALLDVEARVFPSRAKEMASALDQSGHRYVVSNLLEAGFNPAGLDDAVEVGTSLPAGFPVERLNEFPYNQRLVFRSGPYLVHEVNSPAGTITTEYLPLAE